MKIVIPLICLLVSCLAFPKIKERSSYSGAMKKAITKERGEYKRELSDYEAEVAAFNLIDDNKDGHITASEWAWFYSIEIDTSVIEGLPDLTYFEWYLAFLAQMEEEGFDRNQNGQMELSEFMRI